MSALAILGSLFIGAGLAVGFWAATARVARLRVRIPHDVGYRPGEAPPGRFAALARLADGALGRRGLAHGLAADLRKAGLKRSAGDFLVAVGAGSAAVAFLFGALTRSLPAALLLGAAAAFGARFWVRRRAAGWGDAFEAELPDALDLLAGSLEAGSSLAQAMELVAAEGRPPLSEELAHVLADNALGEPLPDALEASAARMGSQDYGWVARAVRVQQEYGASLADLLRTLAEFVRWRQELRREVRALTAEGRISAYILIALPFAIGGYFTAVRPDYIGTLFASPLGWMMVVLAGVLMAVGTIWMTRIVKVEV